MERKVNKGRKKSTPKRQSEWRGKKRKKKKAKKDAKVCNYTNKKEYKPEPGLARDTPTLARTAKKFSKQSSSLSFSYNRFITGDHGPLSFFKSNASPLGYDTFILYSFPLSYYYPGPSIFKLPTYSSTNNINCLSVSNLDRKPETQTSAQIISKWPQTVSYTHLTLPTILRV